MPIMHAGSPVRGERRGRPIRRGARVQSDVVPGRGELRAVFLDERDGPLPALLLALTCLAGVLDAVSILRLGHVFVATVTGNLVFIGLAAAGAKGFAVSTSALAIGGFVVGVLIGARAARSAHSHRGLAPRNVLAVKLWLASAVTLLAVIVGSPLPTGARDTMVVLLSMSMGAQLAVIRYMKVPDLLTVVLTMTITGVLTEHASGWTDPRMLRRGLAVLAFVVGAVCATLLILHVGVAAALFFGVLIISSVAVAAHLLSRRAAGWSAPRSP